MLALSSTFENESGQKITVNELRDQVILLQDINNLTLDRIGEEVKRYYWKSYLDKVSVTDQRKNSNKRDDLILAFTYSLNSDGISITFRRISLPILKKHFGYSPINPNSNFIGDEYISATKIYEKHIQPLSIKEQKALLNELLEAHGKKIIKYGNETEAFPPRLTDALIDFMKTKGVKHVYDEVLRRNSERQYFYKEFMKLMPELEGGTKGTIVQLRQTLTIIGMLMNKQGLLLLPFLWAKEQWLDYIKDSLFEVASKFMSPQVKKGLFIYGKNEFREHGSIYSFVGLFLCSTIASYKDYTPKMKYIIKNAVEHTQSLYFANQVVQHLSKLQLLVEAAGCEKEWINYDPTLPTFNERKNPTEILTLSSIYENELGNHIIINEYSDRIIKLKDANTQMLNNIAIEVKQYLMKSHLENLRSISPITIARKAENDQTIVAFSAHKVNGKYINFTKISIDLLRQHFGYSHVHPNYSDDNTISIHEFYVKHIQPLHLKEQQILYDELLSKHGKKIARFTDRRESFPFDIVDFLIEVIKTKGVEYVYNGALMLSKEPYFYKRFMQRILRMDTFSYGTTGPLNTALVLVGMQLRKHNILLLPFMWIKDVWKQSGLNQAATLLMSEQVKKTLNNFKYLTNQINEGSLSNEIDTVVGLYLCSTIKSHKDFTPMLKYIIQNIGDNSTRKNSYSTQLKTHLYRLQRYAIASGHIRNWKEYQPARTSIDLIYLKDEAKKYPHLIEWIKLANTYLSTDVAQRRKAVHQHENAIKQWIIFLGTLKQPPLKPTEASRQKHIRNVLDPDNKKYFYNVITNFTIAAKQKNLYLRRVQMFFNFIHDSLFYEMPTLIIDDDKLFLGGQRNKTARKRIPTSLLSVAKVLLFKETAHIETFQSAKNAMYNQQTRETKIVWWPGYKNLMKILLFLPIRNKQGRWVDSGELDEFIIDYKKMEYFKNPSPYAIKGRKSCVLQIEIDPITSEKHFIFYVSTNKTGHPYKIPYVPYEIIEAIKDQQEFNQIWAQPLTKPVKAVDKASKEPEKASKLYPDICPLFRLPVGKITDNQAIDGDRLMKFFIHLLEGVQAIVNNEGKDITLVTYQKPGSSRKKALFDIHALRVTGISELIEAGVPVDIVAEFVAGHANQVMTLYYNVQKHTKVREELEKARNDINAKETIIDFMEDLDEFEEYLLVNEADGDKNVSLDFLSAKDSLTQISLDGICPGVSCSTVGRDDKCCPKCPVWMTGPAFLVGQTMKINTLIFQIRKSAEKLASYRKDKIAETNPLRTQHLISQEESETYTLEQMLSEWGLRYRFLQRSIAIADDFENFVNSKNASSRMAILTTNSTLPSIKLEESDELGILNHICQAGAIFEEMTIQEAQYDLEYLLNQLLGKNGIYPFLVLLDKETAKKTSLMLVDGLLARYNSSELLEMINGNKSLDQEDIDFISSHVKDTDNMIINNTIYLEKKHE
ncbi:VPA1269 family protein [Sulfurovum sp.]|uniref:VPA1269 family protein n=1 Tax=Sulfurovum sp. TaxID=1969726 RepID=UPI003562140F